MPPVSPCAPWRCSGTSPPTGLVRAATTRRVVHRSITFMASSITPTGSTICSSPPPWEGENYEPRNPMESGTLGDTSEDKAFYGVLLVPILFVGFKGQLNPSPPTPKSRRPKSYKAL